MRLIFMGTPDFALAALKALIAAGHTILAAYCQPPRPAGRGHKEQPSPVEAFALGMGIAVRHPASLKAFEDQAAFAALKADLAVVAAYGLILPKPILAAPRLGCLNIHASLLPRWRGAAPIQRAILAGDAETGVTIMRMDEGLDTGPMLLAEPVPIGFETTAGQLHDQLAELGGRLIVRALADLDRLKETPQPAQGVTYAAKIAREDSRIDWRQPAEAIARQVRAMAPAPGAWFLHGSERVKLLAARTTPGTAEPGMVGGPPLRIACGQGFVLPLRLQRAGRAPMDVLEFLRGYDLPAGTVLA
jgi:methionyl-tRNA formyltransferase